MNPIPILQVSNVSKVYANSIRALDSVSFSVQEQEFVYLMGRSGAGKSTLFKLITKQEEPDEGKILIENESLAKIPHRKNYLIRRKIGIVFQDFNLIEYKNIFDNVAFPLEIKKHSAKYINKQVQMVLKIVGLDHRQKSMPETLSGGEQQRVAIARAIVTKPGILLADEPTGNLDFKTSEEIMELFTQINQMGTSILMATHDLDIVAGTGRKIVMLDHGQKTGESFG